jgi:hypothetical protein
MKPIEIYKGLQVVLNDSPNATVYTITETQGNWVHIAYDLLNGKRVAGTWVDVSVLRLPDIYQMANI